MAQPNRAAVNRRTLLRGAGGGVLAAGWLVACGGDDEPSASGTTTPDDSSSGGGEELAATADVEVGGGVIVQDKYVITQPAKGEFKAFSAICTHMSCVVGDVVDGEIVCPCHGSHFSIEDGSVTGGPAPAPLPEQAITVEGGEILLA
jgi:Rieske Fe-S protein